MLILVPFSTFTTNTHAIKFNEDQEIKIGVVTARSGALGYYGDMEINGMILGLMYELGIDTFQTVTVNMEWTLNWNGKTIRIIAEDDVDPSTGVSDPSIAASKARKLIEEDNVDILQGCASSDSAIAVEQIAEQYGVVFLVSPAADSDITAKYFNRYTFQISSNTWHDALAGATWAVENLGKKFAFIAPAYSWGYSTVKSWSKVIEDNGGEVVDIEYAPLTTTDFSPYINRIKTSGAEVLIPVWAGSGAITLYAQIKSLGVYDVMNVTSGIPDLVVLNLLLSAYLPAYKGMMKYCWNLPDNDVNDWLINKYVELYKTSSLPTMGVYLPAFPLPDLFVGNGFIVGQAIGLALKKTNGDTSANALISALEGLEFDSPKGRVTIRASDHRTIQDMYIAEITLDNTSLKQYYNITDIPAIYQPFYTNGFLAPKLIEVKHRVTPPDEVSKAAPAGVSPVVIGGISLIIIIAIVAAAFIIRRRPTG